MCKKVETCEGGLNPSNKETSTQKWLENWIASASAEEKSKTKQWLESWANHTDSNKTKDWLEDWVVEETQEPVENSPTNQGMESTAYTGCVGSAISQN